MSETSLSVVGEKCGVASPPDTSVSSTSCVDNQPVRRSTLLTGSTENLLTHDMCVKESCDTEESEVTSSSEIVSKLWNVFPPSFDAVYSDLEKNSLDNLTDEDISCLQTVLSTEEGMLILEQALMRDTMSGGCAVDENLAVEHTGVVVGEKQYENLSDPISELLLGSSCEQVTPAHVFDSACSGTSMNRSHLCENDFLNVIPEMFPMSVADAFFGDILDVLSCGNTEGQRLFDDDDCDMDSHQISIDASHIDDLILPDLPPVDGRDDNGQRLETVLSLDADKDLDEIDENLLQSLSFIDQNYESIRDSNLDFIFDDGNKFTDDDDVQLDSCSDSADESKYDATNSKQLRRSTRIKEYEEREMAQKIREENNSRAKDSVKIEELFPEDPDNEKMQKDVKDDMFPIYEGYMAEKNVGIAFSSGGSGKGNKIQLVAGKTSKNISQKRQACQKGKGKGHGKGGIIGKGGWSVSKAAHTCNHLTKAGSEEEIQDTYPDVGMIDEDSRSSCPDDDKLDEPDEKSFPKILSIKVGECNGEPSASNNIFCDQKLRAMTKVRLGRLEDDVALAKPAVDVSQTVIDAEQGCSEQDPVFTRPQTAKRRKRKRTDSSSGAELSIGAEKERRDKETVENFDLKSVSNETVVQDLLPVADCDVRRSVGKIKLKNICRNNDTKKNKNQQEIDSLEKTLKPKVIKVKFKDRSYVQKVFKKRAPVSVAICAESEDLSQNHGLCKKITNELVKNCQKKFKDSGDKTKETSTKDVPKGSIASLKEKSGVNDTGKRRLQGPEKTDGKKQAIIRDRATSEGQNHPSDRGSVEGKRKICARDRIRPTNEPHVSRCQGCLTLKQSSSMFCGKSCRLKYAKRIVGHLRGVKRNQQMQSSSGEVKPARALILIEKSTMKRVSVSLNCSETKLLNWLLKHPKYEILRPNGQLPSETRTNEKIVMKKKMETKPANVNETLGSKAPDGAAQSLERLSDKIETTQDKSSVKTSKVLKLFPSASQKAASNPNKLFSAADKNVAKLSSSTLTKAVSMPLSENHKSQNVSSHSKATTDKEGLKAVTKIKPVHQEALLNKETVPDRRNTRKKSDDSFVDFGGNASGRKKNSNEAQHIGERNRLKSEGSERVTLKRNSTKPVISRSNSVKTQNQHDDLSTARAELNEGRNPDDNKTDQKDRPTESEVNLDRVRANVRTELCGILTSRANRSSDLLLSIAEIKHLAMNIEGELWLHCRKSSGSYKERSKSLLSHLTDQKNQGIFRRVLRGVVKPNQLVRMVHSSESMAVCSAAKVPTVDKQSKTVAASALAIADSTAMHGQHVFDVNCRICTGAASDSATVKRSKSRITTGARDSNCGIAGKESRVEKLDESQQQKSAVEILGSNEVADLVEVFPKSSVKPESALIREEDDVPSWLNAPPVIIPKNSPTPDSDLTDPRDRTRVIPRNSSLCRIKQYSTSSSSEVAASSGFSLVASEQPRDVEPDVDDDFCRLAPGSLVWKGSIFARDVALLAVDAFFLSGSMKFVKTILPDSLTVMGRLEPEVVYEYLTKLKTCYSATKEIAVVCFRASNDPNSSLYSLLFSYLHQRNRCGVIGSIGSSIKDMYIVPLPAKSPIPDILLPDIEAVLTRGRDLLLGVIVQQASQPSSQLSRPVGSKGSHRHHATIQSDVPEPEVEERPAAEPSEKCSLFNVQSPGEVKEAAGSSHSSDSSDSESVDTNRSDGIVSEYCKPASAKVTGKEAVDDSAIKIVSSEPVADEANTDMTNDDGDEPYDPFDGEDDDLESSVTPNHSLLSLTSKSSSLSSSPVRLLPEISSVRREGVTGLATLLGRIAQIPGTSGLLSRLASESAKPNLEGYRQLIAQLALLFSSHMISQRQNLNAGKVDSAASSCLNSPIFTAETVSKISDSVRKESVNDGCKGVASESRRRSENRSKNGVESKDGSVFCANGGDQAPLGMKQEKNDPSGHCLQVDSLGFVRNAGFPNSSIQNDDCKHITAADDAFDGIHQHLDDVKPAGNKDVNEDSTSNEFVDLEEDDNEDHLIIDLDGPQTNEENHNKTSFTTRSLPSSSSTDVNEESEFRVKELEKEDPGGLIVGRKDTWQDESNSELKSLPCDNLVKCSEHQETRLQEETQAMDDDFVDVEEGEEFDSDKDEDTFVSLLPSAEKVSGAKETLLSEVDRNLKSPCCNFNQTVSESRFDTKLDILRQKAAAVLDLNESDGHKKPSDLLKLQRNFCNKAISQNGPLHKDPQSSQVPALCDNEQRRVVITETLCKEKVKGAGNTVPLLPAPPLPPESLLKSVMPLPEPLLKPSPPPPQTLLGNNFDLRLTLTSSHKSRASFWPGTFSGPVENNAGNLVVGGWLSHPVGQPEAQDMNVPVSSVNARCTELMTEDELPLEPCGNSLEYRYSDNKSPTAFNRSYLLEEQRDGFLDSNDLQECSEDVPFRILSLDEDENERSFELGSSNSNKVAHLSHSTPDARLRGSFKQEHTISTGRRQGFNWRGECQVDEPDLKRIHLQSPEASSKPFNKIHNTCETRNQWRDPRSSQSRDFNSKYGEHGAARYQRNGLDSDHVRFRKVLRSGLRVGNEIYSDGGSDGKKSYRGNFSGRRETKRHADDRRDVVKSDHRRSVVDDCVFRIHGEESYGSCRRKFLACDQQNYPLPERRHDSHLNSNRNRDGRVRARSDFSDFLSKDHLKELDCNELKLHNPDARWSSEAVRRGVPSRQYSTLLPTLLQVRETNFAERKNYSSNVGSTEFEDEGEEVEEEVEEEEIKEEEMDFKKKGAVWKREVRLRGVKSVWKFDYGASEEKSIRSKDCIESEEPVMEIRIRGGNEEEHEEGEYVDEQEEEIDEKHFADPVTNLNFRKIPQPSVEGISQKLEGNCLPGDHFLPVQKHSENDDGSGCRKFNDLTVQIGDAGEERHACCDDELEDGEIADLSPPLPDAGSCSSVSKAEREKDYFHARQPERNCTSPTLLPSLPSDICWSPQLSVPLMTFEKKHNSAAEYERRLASSCDDSSHSSSVLISYADGNYDHYDRYLVHPKRYADRMAGLKDSRQYFPNSSRTSVWNDSESRKSQSRRIHNHPMTSSYPSL